MANSSTSLKENVNLKKIFQDGLDLFNNVETTNDPLNSSHIQVDLH